MEQVVKLGQKITLPSNVWVLMEKELLISNA